MTKKEKAKLEWQERHEVVGWNKVEIPSHMLDSIWQNPDDGRLKVIFATGQTMTQTSK